MDKCIRLKDNNQNIPFILLQHYYEFTGDMALFY